MIKATVTGRLTRDFELRKDEEDNSWGVFTVATNRRYLKAGAEKPDTDYINVYVRGKFADTCAKHLRKGTFVTVVGDLEINKSTGKDGKEYTNVEIKSPQLDWCNTSAFANPQQAMPEAYEEQ